MRATIEWVVLGGFFGLMVLLAVIAIYQSEWVVAVNFTLLALGTLQAIQLHHINKKALAQIMLGQGLSQQRNQHTERGRFISHAITYVILGSFLLLLITVSAAKIWVGEWSDGAMYGVASLLVLRIICNYHGIRQLKQKLWECGEY